MQDPKKSTKSRHLGTITQLCWAMSSQLRHVLTIGKNFLSSNMFTRSPHNMVNFGPLTADIASKVWGTPANFKSFCVFAATCPQNTELRPTSGWDRSSSLGQPCKFKRVSCLGSVTARHYSTGHQPNFAALNRGHHLCSAGRPSRWAHILVHVNFHWTQLTITFLFVVITSDSVTVWKHLECWMLWLNIRIAWRTCCVFRDLC